VKGKAVASKSCLCGQHTGIHDTAHALQQISRNTRPVTLDGISSPHAVCGDDVTLGARLFACHKSQMSAAVRVVFNPIDSVLSRFRSFEIDGPDSPPVTTTSVSDRDLTRIVATTLSVTDFGKGEFGQRLAFPEVVVDGPTQPSCARCARLVCLQLELVVPARWSLRCAEDCCLGAGRARLGWILRRWCGIRADAAEGVVEGGAALSPRLGP